MVIAPPAEIVRYALMADKLKDPATMTDAELVQEWHCIECDSEDAPRTDELAAELDKRNIDV